MNIIQCFYQDCMNEVEDYCTCTSPETYFCRFHFADHCKFSIGTHTSNPLFVMPIDGSKKATLELLEEEISKATLMKVQILNSFIEVLNYYKSTFDNTLKEIDNKLTKFKIQHKKVKQAQKVSKFESEEALKLLLLQPNEISQNSKVNFANNLNNIISPFNKINNEISKFIKTFYDEKWNNAQAKIDPSINDNLCRKIGATIYEEKRHEETQLFLHEDWEATKLAILPKANNPETEREFRETCVLYERYCSIFNLPFSQNYQEYLNSCHKIASLYYVWEIGNITKLVIYDTESEKLEQILLDTPEPLDNTTFITGLPNGELFCHSNGGCSGITLIINRYYKVRILPTGKPFYSPSGIYFKNSIYCFGVDDMENSLASKFDFNESRWFDLNPIQKDDRLRRNRYSVASLSNSVVFSNNILIIGFFSKNIFMYSIDIDSFSKIPYEFNEKDRKILINTGRLHLIEPYGWIYESEDEFNWQKLKKSIIANLPTQIYYAYNKEGIYITGRSVKKRYKFDLKQKCLVKFY